MALALVRDRPLSLRLRAPESERTCGSGIDRGIVRYSAHVPTYVNGFAGTGLTGTKRLCQHPVRTDLKVTTPDVLAAVGTLRTYTPHTLNVSCPRDAAYGIRLAER